MRTTGCCSASSLRNKRSKFHHHIALSFLLIELCHTRSRNRGRSRKVPFCIGRLLITVEVDLQRYVVFSSIVEATTGFVFLFFLYSASFIFFAFSLFLSSWIQKTRMVGARAYDSFFAPTGAFCYVGLHAQHEFLSTCSHDVRIPITWQQHLTGRPP